MIRHNIGHPNEDYGKMGCGVFKQWPKYQKLAKAKRPNEAWQTLDVHTTHIWNKILIEIAKFCLFVCLIWDTKKLPWEILAQGHEDYGNTGCGVFKRGQSYTSQVGFPTGRDSGQRDRSSFIVPGQKGQRDKLKMLPRDGTGRDSQNPGQDAWQNGTEQKKMF